MGLGGPGRRYPGTLFAGAAMGELVLTLGAIGALLWLGLDIIVRLSQP